MPTARLRCPVRRAVHRRAVAPVRRPLEVTSFERPRSHATGHKSGVPYRLAATECVVSLTVCVVPGEPAEQPRRLRRSGSGVPAAEHYSAWRSEAVGVRGTRASGATPARRGAGVRRVP